MHHVLVCRFERPENVQWGQIAKTFMRKKMKIMRVKMQLIVK